MKIDRLDHLVLTVRDVKASCAFYSQVLAMEIVTFGDGRTALSFGSQKINLHPADAPFEPHALVPMPGSADLCFISDEPISNVIAHPEMAGVAIIEGPIARTGAMGAITSVYLRDPDGNLIEVSTYN